jgi:hypothetical protein
LWTQLFSRTTGTLVPSNYPSFFDFLSSVSAENIFGKEKLTPGFQSKDQVYSSVAKFKIYFSFLAFLVLKSGFLPVWFGGII